MPHNERMEIVRAIEYVDAVAPQEDMDKFEMWNKLKFDVMFVGDDWFNSSKWDWFGGHFNEYAKEILLSKEAKARGIYNVENIEKWLKSDRLSKDHSFAMKIWMLINLELFAKKYF